MLSAGCVAFPQLPAGYRVFTLLSATALFKKGKYLNVQKLSVITLLLGLTALTPGIVSAAGPSPAQKKPAQNISPRKHPNLAAAQRLAAQAFQKISAAQQANEWDMEGHAQKAKDLLDQVNNELKQAAEAANKNK